MPLLPSYCITTLIMGRGGLRLEGADKNSFFQPHSASGTRVTTRVIPPSVDTGMVPSDSLPLTTGERALMDAIEAFHKKTDKIGATVEQFGNKLEALNSRVSGLELKVHRHDERIASPERLSQELQSSNSLSAVFGKITFSTRAALGNG